MGMIMQTLFILNNRFLLSKVRNSIAELLLTDNKFIRQLEHHADHAQASLPLH